MNFEHSSKPESLPFGFPINTFVLKNSTRNSLGSRCIVRPPSTKPPAGQRRPASDDQISISTDHFDVTISLGCTACVKCRGQYDTQTSSILSFVNPCPGLRYFPLFGCGNIIHQGHCHWTKTLTLLLSTYTQESWTRSNVKCKSVH